MAMQQFVAALIIAALAALIVQALYDGVRGDVDQQKPVVMGIGFVILATLAVAMNNPVAWGAFTGGFVAIAVMFAIHMAYSRQTNATTPRPALTHRTR